MLATKISSKGQVVVPKVLRDKLKIKPGTFFHVHLERDNIVLTPVKSTPLERLYGKFAGETILDEFEADHAEEIASEYRT